MLGNCVEMLKELCNKINITGTHFQIKLGKFAWTGNSLFACQIQSFLFFAKLEKIHKFYPTFAVI